jgi:hypothetical protein
MSRARDNADLGILGGSIEGTEVAFLENSSGQDLTGTYSTERMYLSGRTGSAPNDYNYKLTGDVTVTGHLALGSIADADVVITQDSTERTITGAGTLESGELLQSKQTDLTGMTGTIGSSVVFPSGMPIDIQQVTYTSATSNNTPNAWQNWPGAIGAGNLSITPKSTSSKFYISWSLFISRLAGTYSVHARLARKIGSGSWNDLIAVGDVDSSRTRGTFAVRTIHLTTDGEAYEPPRSGSFLDSPTLSNITDSVYYKFTFNNDPGGSNTTYTFFNRNSSDWDEDRSGSRMISTLTMQEIAG